MEVKRNESLQIDSTKFMDKHSVSKKKAELSIDAKEAVDDEFDEEITVYTFSPKSKKTTPTAYIQTDLELQPEIIALIESVPPKVRKEMLLAISQINNEIDLPKFGNMERVTVSHKYDPLYAVKAYDKMISSMGGSIKVSCAHDHCNNHVMIMKDTDTFDLLRPLCKACSGMRSTTPPPR